eukprot:9126647-Pyramimonas_sp.AAC.1
MDPFSSTLAISSAQNKYRIRDTVAHPKNDPIGSIGGLVIPVRNERTFGLGVDSGDEAQSYVYRSTEGATVDPPARKGG